MEHLNPSADIEDLENLQEKILNPGEISREVMTIYSLKPEKNKGLPGTINKSQGLNEEIFRVKIFDSFHITN